MSLKKRYVLTAIVFLIIIIFSIPLIYRTINPIGNIPISIDKPEKIIIYNNNKSVTINEEDKNFDKILKLTSKRLSSSKNITNSPNQDSINEVNKIKYAWKSIEFIYNQPATLEIKSNHNTNPNSTFKKMFFLISAEKPTDFGSNIFLGEEQYTSEVKNINADSKTMNKLLQIIEQEIP